MLMAILGVMTLVLFLGYPYWSTKKNDDDDEKRCSKKISSSGAFEFSTTQVGRKEKETGREGIIMGSTAEERAKARKQQTIALGEFAAAMLLLFLWYVGREVLHWW